MVFAAPEDEAVYICRGHLLWHRGCGVLHFQVTLLVSWTGVERQGWAWVALLVDEYSPRSQGGSLEYMCSS
jgi:hypothetical protein